MKKIFTLFFAGMSMYAQSQRLFTEDFNYALGALTSVGGADVSGGVWTNFSGTGNYLQVTAGNLTYPNYFTGPTPTSNKLTLVDFPTSSEDVLRGFTIQTSGTVYASFLIKVLKSDNLALNSSTGEYFASFLPSTSTSDFRGRVLIRQGSVANTVNFGITTTSATATNVPVFDATNYAINTTHLITFAYQFVSGSLNDIAKLWVNKPFSATEPPPSAIATFPLTGNGAVEFADLARFVWRQAAFNTPNADVDALVVATSYSDATLPLSLTSFKASFNGKATQVKWSTENEVNVSGFAIEKSLDGINFSPIDFVSAKNSSTHTEYSTTDDKVKGGTSYYRLKQVDKNGSFKYSSVEVIKNSLTIKTEVFPNPTRGNLTINHSVAIKGAAIKVMNIEGKLIKTLPVQAGSTQTALSVTDVIKGNYLLMFENEGSKSITQFSKQ